MLKILRNRLILSHILPVLLILPLMGIALIYSLETQVILPSLASKIQGYAHLLASITSSQPEIWKDGQLAQAVLAEVNPDASTRVMLISPAGRLLASTDATDSGRIGQVIDVPSLAEASAGTTVTITRYSERLQGNVVEILAPVASAGHLSLGMIRISHPYSTIYEQFTRVRYLILEILLLGLFLGILLGSLLAISISQPIKQVTEAVLGIARGEFDTPLPMDGPEEIVTLLNAVKVLVSRLRSLEAARQQLLANLIHEIARPLGALRSANQAILEGADRDTAFTHELLVGMDEEMGRLQHLLEELRHLHDQILGPLELDCRSVGLKSWLPRLLIPWKEAALTNGLVWQEEFEADLPVLNADPDRLAQAISNLVSNALKYTPEGGQIKVSAGGKDSQVWIRVGDTGSGISPQELEHVFQPFYRGHDSRRFPEGMGLGLSIAGEIIAAHGGRIEVTSTVGKGSQFTIFLPVYSS